MNGSFSPKPEGRKVITPCRVDCSEAPEMLDFANKAARLVEDVYPRIQNKLDPSYMISSLILKFKKDQTYPGLVVGFTINLSSQWFLQHPDDLGAVVHETTHVAQAYGPSQPSWLVEGIADYMRFWLGYQNSWSYPHCDAHTPHYLNGYSCAAAFLQYVERVYDKDIVPKVHIAMRSNKYNDLLFKELTGKIIQELWPEALNAECKGGSLYKPT
jgi:hypothetical protein